MEQIEQILKKYGYNITKRNVHAVEFSNGKAYFYYIPGAKPNLVINPAIKIPTKFSYEVYHNSNLTEFPKRQNKDSAEIHYGNRLIFDDNQELEKFVGWFEVKMQDTTTSYLNIEDIDDNIVIIKINKLYRDNMSAEELYEATRGIWKRKIESVAPADYCLSVAKSIVVGVYKVNQWYKAGTTPMKSRTFTEEECKNRIEFVGELAPDSIREKYIGKSVANLYKQGEADPVKVFLNHKTVADINTGVEPLELSTKEGKTIVTCPNCKGLFEKAPRCPECGQLIKYE